MTVPEHAIHSLEVVAPDVEAARPELGKAVVAVLPGGSPGGIRAPIHELERPTVRTYVRVRDVHASVAKAAELGATDALEPTVLPGQGTIAIYPRGGV